MVRSPASNKKAAENAARKKGRTRRRYWTHQQHHPLQAVSGALDAVTVSKDKTQECLTSCVPRSHAIQLVQHRLIRISAYGLPTS